MTTMQETTTIKNDERVSLSVRVSQEEMEIVRKVADSNCRTVSDQLRFMIKQLGEESRR